MATTTPQSGFLSFDQYKAPTQTASAGMSGAGDNYNFYTPSDTKLPTGKALSSYLTPPGATADQVQNRTVKYDGALTREQVGNVGEALSGQIGTVNTNLQNGINGLGTGLETVNNNVNTVNTNLATGIKGVNEGMATGFAGVNNNLNTGLKGVDSNVTAVGEAVKAGNTAQATGFANIGSTLAAQGTDLNKIGSNLTSYFNSLNAGQQAAKTQVGALQTGFDGFNNQYTKDTVRNDQNMADLQQSVTGGFDTMQGNMNNQFDAQARTANGLMSAVGGGSSPQAQAGAAGISSAMGGSAMAPGGAPAPNGGGMSPIAQQANMARQIMTQMAGTLPPEYMSTIASFASSFDPGGNFVPRTDNPDGSFVTRQAMPDGNISITGVDAMGGVRRGILNIQQATAMMGQVTGQAPYRTA